MTHFGAQDEEPRIEQPWRMREQEAERLKVIAMSQVVPDHLVLSQDEPSSYLSSGCQSLLSRNMLFSLGIHEPWLLSFLQHWRDAGAHTSLHWSHSLPTPPPPSEVEGRWPRAMPLLVAGWVQGFESTHPSVSGWSWVSPKTDDRLAVPACGELGQGTYLAGA